MNQLKQGARMKTGMVTKTEECEFGKASFWQLVFSQSKVNGAPYWGEQLQGQIWDWPKNTFLQRRLRRVRWLPNDNRNFN